MASVIENYNQSSVRVFVSNALAKSSVFYLLITFIFLSVSGLNGMDWEPRDRHFKHVNDRGKLLYDQRLGHVQLGSARIPVYAYFTSTREADSQILGRGWSIPFIESIFLQEDKNLFKLKGVNGKFESFRRNKQNPNELLGPGKSKAVIKNNTITITYEDGWKLKYKNGRIDKITTPEEKSARYIYADGNFERLVDDSGAMLIEIEENDRIKMAIGDANLIFELAEKPRIESVGGNLVVAAVDKSLGMAKYQDGSKQTFDYSLQENSLMPVFRVGDGRMIQYDPVNGNLITDGDWRYQINYDADEHKSEIRRTNHKTQKSQAVINNYKLGEYTIEDNGLTKTVKRFSSGKLKNKVRLVESFSDKKQRSSTRFSYNETGKLIKVSGNSFKLVNIGDNTIELTRNSQKEALISFLPESKTVHWQSLNIDKTNLELTYDELLAMGLPIHLMNWYE